MSLEYCGSRGGADYYWDPEDPAWKSAARPILPDPTPRQRGLAERQPFQGRLGDWRDKFDLGTRFEQGVVTATDWNLRRVVLNGGKKWIDIGRLIPL